MRNADIAHPASPRLVPSASLAMGSVSRANGAVYALAQVRIRDTHGHKRSLSGRCIYSGELGAKMTRSQLGVIANLRGGASVTWQDELQQLDAELAAGRISAEDYRKRRDSITGRAQQDLSSGGFARQSPPAGRFPQQNPHSDGFVQQQHNNPFPPAFSWNNATAAPQPAPQPRPASVTTPASQPPPWASQQSWASQPGWTSTDGGTGWSDLTRGPEPGEPGWRRQGAEVFENAGAKSSKGKLIAGLSIAIVLIVLVAVSVFFYLNSPGGADPQAGQSTQQQPPPKPVVPALLAPPPMKPAPANPADVLVAAPGPPHPFNGPIDRPSLEGQRSGLLPQLVRDFALQNGLTDGWFNGDDTVAPKTSLLATRMPDENTATGVAKKYLEAQAGLAPLDELSYQGVRVVSTGNGTFRTAYVSHNWVVIVDVSAPQEQQDAAKGQFKSLLDAQLTQTPPTVLK